MSDGTGGSGANGRSPGRRQAVGVKENPSCYSRLSNYPLQGGGGHFFNSPQMQKVPKETGLKDDGNTECRRKRRERLSFIIELTMICLNQRGSGGPLNQDEACKDTGIHVE